MPSQFNINASSVDKSKTSPETQEIFDMFIINGMELIYNEKQIRSMLPRLGAGKDTVNTMAELLVDIIVRTMSSAKAVGKKIPPEVVLHGGNFLFAELLKVLDAAGMKPLTEEQTTAVWQMASSIYIDQAIQSGEMTKQELISLSNEIEQTDEGKKIIQTAKNPDDAIKGIKKSMSEEPEIQADPDLQIDPAPQADPAALAAPSQGGL